MATSLHLQGGPPAEQTIFLGYKRAFPTTLTPTL